MNLPLPQSQQPGQVETVAAPKPGAPVIGLRPRVAVNPRGENVGAQAHAPSGPGGWLQTGQGPRPAALAQLRVSPDQVKGLEDLVERVSFSECLNDKVGLAHYLSYVVAVVSLDPDKHHCGLLLAPKIGRAHV